MDERDAALAELREYRTRRETLPILVRRAFDTGLTQAEIARESGLSRQWVAELLARTGQERQ